MIESSNSIFKYTSINEWSIKSLRDRDIFMNAPCRFNDPYDFAPNMKMQNLSYQELYECYEKLSNGRPIRKIFHGPMQRDFLIHEITRRLRRGIRASIKHASENLGVSCFSESKDIILMWSHYADHHKGMCIEFDTKEQPFPSLCKVEYEIEFPEVNPIFAIREDFNIYMKFFITKYIEWNYEREWRLIVPEADSKQTYSAKAIKAIYFGSRAKESDIKIICQIARTHNPEVKLYKSKMSNTKFELKYRECDFNL